MRSPRSPRPAASCQIAAPKSAPAEHDVEHEPGEDEDHRDVVRATSRQSPPPRGSGARASRRRIHTTPAPTASVDEPQRRVADRDAAGAGDRLPRCASRGRRPTAGARPRSSTQPAISATTDSGPASDERRGRTSATRAARRRRTRTNEDDDAEQRQQRADADHRLEGEAHDVDRRAVVAAATASRPSHPRVRVVEGQQREQLAGSPMPNLTSPSLVPAEDVDRRALLGRAQPLERGELGRLVTRPPRAPPSRRRAAAPARPAPRSSAGSPAPCARSGPSARAGARRRRPPATTKPGDDVAREVHVDELVPEVGVAEQRVHGVDVDRPRRRRARKPPGWFIHPLTAMTISEPVKPVSTIGSALSMCARGDRRSQP